MRGHPHPNLKPVRHLGVLLGAVTLLTACTSSGDGPAPGPARTSAGVPTTCPGGVEITAGTVDAALGLRALGIELRNCGTVPYRVEGFPVIRPLDEHHRALDVKVGNGSAPVSAPDSYDIPPRPVTLQPGEVAQARVLWRNTVTDANQPATTGTYLQIAPAPGKPAQLVAPDGGIDLGTTGRLAVNAWRSSAPATPTSPTSSGPHADPAG